jgi:hypothetical protein
MPYVKDRTGNIFSSAGDKPGSAFKSGTNRFKATEAPGPGFKYVPTKVNESHDHVTASNASAFVSKTNRFPSAKPQGPGLKYSELVDHSKDDPNVPGAVGAFRSRTLRMPSKAPVTANLPPQHYRATHPSDIAEVLKTQETTQGAAFRSRTLRFKDPKPYYGNRALDLKDPREISQLCAPRENTRGVGFATSAERFPDFKGKPLPVFNPNMNTIDYNCNVDTAGGAVSAFRSKSQRFKPPTAPLGDRVLNYKHPLDIQTRVGEYMGK